MIKDFEDIINKINTNLKKVSPSDFAEKYRTLTSDVSTRQGKFRYSGTPYLKEVVDTLSPDHPAKIIAVMKGAQIGFTEGVIVNGILWMIANNPGNTLFLAANDELAKETIESRLDQGIASCGISDLIRPNTIRKRNSRTGDTSKSKEYAGGRLFSGGANSIDKLARQRSVKYGFFDDYSSYPSSDKQQGNLYELIQQRFSTSAKSMKQFYISTPETFPDNTEQVYEMGDKRKWMTKCPLCHNRIEILFNYHLMDEPKEGILFERDKDGILIDDSVVYKCQECGGIFKETHKYDMNLTGIWVPTAKPLRPWIYSYHIPCFISAPWMYNWTDYVHKWMGIYNQGNVNQSKLKVFINQVIGIPYEEKEKQIKDNALLYNTRDYNIQEVPLEMSKMDGNGNIVLLTCSCDLNGTLDDARLDYDVWAHSANGSIYSIDQGSIGTSQPGRKKENRTLFTYRHGGQNNVWDIFEDVILRKYNYQTIEGFQPVLIVGIDMGYLDVYGWEFINKHPGLCVGVKGSPNDKFTKAGNNTKLVKKSVNKSNLYLLESNLIKDQLAGMINLEWKNKNVDQPEGFMNFPNPYRGKYSAVGYFAQFEAEHKILQQSDDGEPTGWRWDKKTQSSQNHFFDTACYNLAVKEIFLERFLKELKIKDGKWSDFAEAMNSIIER